MKNLTFIIGCFCISVFTVALTHCSVQSNISNEYIKPAIEGVDVPFEQYTVKAEKGGVISLPSGTSIEIPANAFVTEDGTIVTGKVDIKYREFHNATDIIASGIPMTYDSAGVTQQFQTAGMFEIQGSLHNSNLKIAEGKELTVNMGSAVGENDYKFYKLNPQKRNWEFKQSTTPNVNTQKVEALALLENKPKEPVMPKKYKKGMKILDLDINYKSYPELRSLNGVMWTFSGTDSSMAPQNNEWIYTTSWTSVLLEPYNEGEMKYKLVLKNGKQEFYTIISPVISAKNYSKASAKFAKKMDKYKQKLVEYQALEERAKVERDFIRSMAIQSFGIYNYDRMLKIPLAISMNANFTVDGKEIEWEEIKVYLISGSDRAVMVYPRHQWNMFRIDPTADNKLVVVTADKKAAVLSGSKIKALIKNIPTNEAYSNKKVSFTFDLEKQSKKIETAEDLGEILNAI